MENKRTNTQDIAKGLLIIGVVAFHSYLMVYPNYRDVLQDFNILMAIIPFIISTFFFYSGYNYNPSSRSTKENIVRRAKQLLIPFVIAFVVSTILISSMELAFHHDQVGETFVSLGNSILFNLLSEPLSLMIKFPQSGGMVFELTLALGLLWFLYALFLCSVIFFFVVKYTNKKLSSFISVVLALLILSFCLGQFVAPYLPYSIQCYPIIIAIMLTGSYIKQHNNILDNKVESKKDIVFKVINMLIAEGLIIAICLLCYYQFGAILVGSLPGGQFNAILKGYDAFISYAFAFLGVYFLHHLARLISHIPGLRFSLQWIGKRSAIFYLFHPIFIDFIGIVFFQKQMIWGIWQAILYMISSLLLLVGVCLIIDLISKKFKKKDVAVDENPSIGNENGTGNTISS